MEQAAPKQRSPWFYVLLGCGGFALLSCLGAFLVLAVGVKKVNDLQEGVSNPKVRTENARKMLGELPPGYVSAVSLSMFGLVDIAVLTNGEGLADGGVEVGDRVFTYYRMVSNADNERTKAYFRSGEGDLGSLRNSGVNIDKEDVIKRGNLTVAGRKLYYVAYRGVFGVGNESASDGLNLALLFDCPGEQLHAGVWAMRDPTPQKPIAELDLTGTVADEAVLAAFVKPMNPCGR
ncbi:MAG: hypothetical protein INH41_18425 [Myxococcaceae bacterium]|jgi:hypothetical protein|nr:hypothetical protein [Myxococcaceae bacterium]MCA3014363.1 hypothetical protein [Myxococcaceae bacterium]